MIIESEQAFSDVRSAVRTLVDFYESIIESTTLPENASLRAQLLQMGVPNGPFELVFRLRDQYNYPNTFVPMALARYICQLFLRRAQRGSAVQVAGVVGASGEWGGVGCGFEHGGRGGGQYLG